MVSKEGFAGFRVKGFQGLGFGVFRGCRASKEGFSGFRLRVLRV